MHLHKALTVPQAGTLDGTEATPRRSQPHRRPASAGGSSSAGRQPAASAVPRGLPPPKPRRTPPAPAEDASKSPRQPGHCRPVADRAGAPQRSRPPLRIARPLPVRASAVAQSALAAQSEPSPHQSRPRPPQSSLAAQSSLAGPSPASARPSRLGPAATAGSRPAAEPTQSRRLRLPWAGPHNRGQGPAWKERRVSREPHRRARVPARGRAGGSMCTDCRDVHGGRSRRSPAPGRWQPISRREIRRSDRAGQAGAHHLISLRPPRTYSARGEELSRHMS